MINNEELIKQLMAQNQMLMQMMQQPNPNPAAPVISPANPTSGMVEVIHNNREVASLQEQLAQLKAELAAAKAEIQSLTEQREQLRHEVREREGQLRNLQIESARTLNAHELIFQAYEIDVDEALANLEDMQGEDYYEEHRQQWYGEGITGKEMHDRVSTFMDKKSDYVNDVIDFKDKARVNPHTADEKIKRAKEEHLQGGSAMHEVRDGRYDFV